jgi:glycerol kinase
MVGITRGTTAAHMARSALESIALQTADVLNAMQRDAGTAIMELRVDGGATTNNLLMQLQADVLGVPVIRPVVTEVTALGAAYLAGLAVGFWKDIDALKNQWAVQQQFRPEQNHQTEILRVGWQNAVKAARMWAVLQQQQTD